MISNYQELVEQVADWTQRTDIVPRIPSLIGLAESEMRANKREPLRILAGDKTSTSTLTEGERFLALPSGYSKPQKFEITVDGNQYELKYRTPQQIDIRTQPGVPVYYTVANGQFEFDATASEDFAVTLHYHGSFEPLTKTNTTNYVLENYPNVYLFGCLKYAFLMLHDDEPRIKHEINFLDAIEAANAAEEDKREGVNMEMEVEWHP
tara:strand:- start:11299 stop:11922 length:624 start_codon:yes stop_codon:yes gene_type:complete